MRYALDYLSMFFGLWGRRIDDRASHGIRWRTAASVAGDYAKMRRRFRMEKPCR